MLLLLLIAALWCVAEAIAEARFNPAPLGTTHHICLDEESSRQITLRLPAGWEPDQLPSTSTKLAKVVFQHAPQPYPSVYIEAVTGSDANETEWSRQFTGDMQLPLLDKLTDSQWAYDVERKTRWRTVEKQSPMRVELELLRSDVHSLIRIFHATENSQAFRETVCNIVDQFQIELTTDTPAAQSSESVASKTVTPQTPAADDEKVEFVMGNGLELITAKQTRLTALIWTIAVLALLIAVHLYLSVIEVNERVRDTKRFMSAIRRGVPLGRAWNLPNTKDTPPT